MLNIQAGLNFFLNYIYIKISVNYIFVKRQIHTNTSIAHRIKNPLRRTAEHIAIIYLKNLFITHNSYGPRVNCERSLASLAITRIYGLVKLLLTNKSSKAYVDLNSTLHKIVLVKNNSYIYIYIYIYICKQDTAFRHSLVNITYYHVMNDV